MRTTGVDRAIALAARRQHGVFSRAQVFAAGGSRRLVERRLAAGDWIRIDAGVYALFGSAGTWQRQLWVALLGVSGGACVAGRSAAVIHELPGFRPGRPEIGIGPTQTARSTVAVVHQFAGVKTTTRQGFPVTTVAQTLIDLAFLGEVWRLERAMDDALLCGRVRLEDLVERLEAYRGSRRHNLRLYRGLVAERRDDAWQPPETMLEAVASEVLASVPGLDVKRRVTMRWREGGAHRFDFVDERNRLIIEVDGRRWHARLDDFDRDRWRDNEAVARGWRVLRFTWVHLTTAPDAVVDLIARTIANPVAS